MTRRTSRSTIFSSPAAALRSPEWLVDEMPAPRMKAVSVALMLSMMGGMSIIKSA